MSTRLTATVLPEFDAVRLVIQDAPTPDGPLEVLRTDVNGTHPVRQLPGAATSAGQLTVTDYELAKLGPVTYQLQGVRTNTVANPSFEADVTGWTVASATVTRDTTWAAPGVGGVASAKLTATAANGFLYPTARPAAAPGETWTASCWVKGTAGQTIQLGVAAYDSAGTSLVGTNYVTVTLTGAAQLLTRSRVLPASTATARMILVAPTSGQVVYVDGALFEEADQAGSYITGTVPATVALTVNPVLTPNPRVAVVGRPAQSMTVTALETYSATRNGGTRLLAIYGGGELPIIGGLDARAGSLGLHVSTYAEAKALSELLASGAIVQLRQETFQGLDLYLTPQRVREDPAPRDNAPAEWVVTVDYKEEAAPDSIDLASGAAWTFADVSATFATFTDVRNAFPSLFALAVGP